MVFTDPSSRNSGILLDLSEGGSVSNQLHLGIAKRSLECRPRKQCYISKLALEATAITIVRQPRPLSPVSPLVLHIGPASS